MKSLALSSCLAVASLAATAEPKDPARVAADWKSHMDQALAPLLAKGPLGLTVTGSPQPGSPPDMAPRASQPPRPRRDGDVLELPPGLQIDPGILKIVPDNGTPPPGAKPWNYNGRKFWLIPITSPSYDAPNNQVPAVLPNNLPPGTPPK